MSGMGIKCLHAGTQHIVGLFDLVYSIQENVIASLRGAGLTYPFCNLKYKEKQKQNTRDDVFMPHGQIYSDALQLLFFFFFPFFFFLQVFLFAADVPKPFLSVFKCVRERGKERDRGDSSTFILHSTYSLLI